jgi:DNA invertase Pin-like site-specific DNA recombinase
VRRHRSSVDDPEAVALVERELEDAAYSGKFLERDDLDELRDLVAAGGVDIVVVSKRDRLACGSYAGYSRTSSSDAEWASWPSTP